MDITKDTRVIKILDAYGDVAEVMESFGVRRVGPFSVRRLVTRFLTVGMAARVHGVPLDLFLKQLRTATSRAAANKAALG
ncbi:MAG: DUF1858 domain-containing protein [Pseudomonadota bacterium]